MSTIRWLPLESNPEVMNKCLRDLGVPEKWGFNDVISFDPELYHMIPTPCRAILLLFPITPKYLEYLEEKEQQLRDIQEIVPDLYYMKQTVSNACGTVAMIHALANNEEHLDLPADSLFKRFLDTTKYLTPEERGKKLEESGEICSVHEAGAQEGQTETPNLDEEVNLHYIALVRVSGKLVELDGRKASYIVHCDTTESTFLEDAMKVCRSYIARDPENLQFTALSFGEHF